MTFYQRTSPFRIVHVYMKIHGNLHIADLLYMKRGEDKRRSDSVLT